MKYAKTNRGHITVSVLQAILGRAEDALSPAGVSVWHHFPTITPAAPFFFRHVYSRSQFVVNQCNVSTEFFLRNISKKLNSERLTVRLGWTVIYFPIFRQAFPEEVRPCLTKYWKIYYSSPEPYGQPFWVQFLQVSHCICWSEPTRFRYLWFVRWTFLELKEYF